MFLRHCVKCLVHVFVTQVEKMTKGYTGLSRLFNTLFVFIYIALLVLIEGLYVHVCIICICITTRSYFAEPNICISVYLSLFDISMCVHQYLP